MDNDLQGKVVIVTGATSGIGRAIAMLYAENGASVMLSGRNENAGRELVGQIVANGGIADFFKADIGDHLQCRQLVQQTVSRFGGLDIACNNAGIGGDLSMTADYSVDTWHNIIAVNLSSVFYCLKYELEVMTAQGRQGSIINMASINGLVGTPYLAGYVAAKHGVIGLTKTAALEYATKGIRINAVAPAYIDTPMLDVLSEEEKTGLNKLHPVGRLGNVDEVSELVIWLSSQKASFMTGGYYPVDGGYLAQ